MRDSDLSWWYLLIIMIMSFCLMGSIAPDPQVILYIIGIYALSIAIVFGVLGIYIAYLYIAERIYVRRNYYEIELSKKTPFYKKVAYNFKPYFPKSINVRGVVYVFETDGLFCMKKKEDSIKFRISKAESEKQILALRVEEEVYALFVES